MAQVLDICAERTKRDAERWRMAQFHTMMDLFEAANGRAPRSEEELARFLDREKAAGRIPAGPIEPTRKALTMAGA